jgi:hypothetical protein
MQYCGMSKQKINILLKYSVTIADDFLTEEGQNRLSRKGKIVAIIMRLVVAKEREVIYHY